MNIFDNRNEIVSGSVYGGGNPYIRPEISLQCIRIEAGFAASPGNLNDFGEVDKAGKDLDINSGYDL